MKVGIALRGLHQAEADLFSLLAGLSERHRDDPELHHLARDLAAWSGRRVAEVAQAARVFGEDLPESPSGDAVLPPADGDPGLVTLRDLRAVYLAASAVSVDWELVAQAARGLRDADLLDLAQRSQAETLRQVKWAAAMIRQTATQVLVS